MGSSHFNKKLSLYTTVANGLIKIRVSLVGNNQSRGSQKKGENLKCSVLAKLVVKVCLLVTNMVSGGQKV